MSGGEFDAPGAHANVRPRDASTLILIDRTGREPKILLGRRHAAHVFMPGQLVFPGGRVDRDDHRIKLAASLPLSIEQRLVACAGSAGRARALAVAAIRELYEETGLCIGTFEGDAPQHYDPAVPFSQLGLRPDLSQLSLVARALTPPGRVRRYDTYFFAADASVVSHRLEGVVGADTELVELVWLTLEAAKDADLPHITRIVLADIEAGIAAGASSAALAPFYRFARGTRRRDLF
jgi:8-oxo-dGTP pyrophosphatase MutT (NUDIX family)